MSEKVEKAEGYGKNVISGTIDDDPGFPGCPFCETHAFVVCGACNKMSCHYVQENGTFTCGFCGASGTLVAAEHFDIYSDKNF